MGELDEATVRALVAVGERVRILRPVCSFVIRRLFVRSVRSVFPGVTVHVPTFQIDWDAPPWEGPPRITIREVEP